MEAYRWYVICVSIFIKGIETLLCLIVPDLDMSIISSRNQVRTIKRRAKVNAIDTCLMTYKGVVCTWFPTASFSWSWYGPYFNSAIERSTCEHICVFWIDSYLHNVMLVIFIRVNLLPAFVPINKLYCLVIWATDHIWKSWMYSKIANKISVFINNFQLFTSVIVVYTNLCIISTNNDPLFSSDKLSTSDWSIRHFKRSNLWLLVVIKYDDCACI